MNTVAKWPLLLCVIGHFWVFVGTRAVPSLRTPKLSLAAEEWNNYYYNQDANSGGKGTYAFGYDIEDVETENLQYRDEEKLANGTVIGSYGYLRPDGRIQTVNYVADALGYRASVETREHKRSKISRNEAVTAK